MNIEDFLIRVVPKIMGEKAIYISNESMSAFIKDFVCKQQLSLTKFIFESANKHKDFKEDQTEEKFQALEDFCSKEMKKSLVSIRESIEEYFKIAHINKNKSAVSIGVFNEDTNGKTLEIITHTDQQLPINKKTKTIKDYSYLEFIVRHGVPYHCNFIPKKIMDDNYKHRDIDVSKARNSYKIRKIQDSKIISRRIFIKKYLSKDKRWEEISHKHELLRLKSTLAVPITFKKWTEFIDDTKLQKLLFPNTGERSIFGCITVEHEDTFFFDDKDPESHEDCDNIDINMLYMFADFVSLYQTIQRNYTICSETWLKFNKIKGR